MKKELKCDVKKNLKEKTAKKHPPPTSFSLYKNSFCLHKNLLIKSYKFFEIY